MRDYQPKQKNPYWLERSVYLRVLALVRDYDRMVRDYQAMLYEGGAAQDGQPRAHIPGDPVERKVERMEVLWQDIHAIESALMSVPPEYRKSVLHKVISDKWPVDVPVGKNLPGYWKKRFLYRVAENKRLI